jgi:hypothetical protein
MILFNGLVIGGMCNHFEVIVTQNEQSISSFFNLEYTFCTVHCKFGPRQYTKLFLELSFRFTESKCFHKRFFTFHSWENMS